MTTKKVKEAVNESIKSGAVRDAITNSGSVSSSGSAGQAGRLKRMKLSDFYFKQKHESGTKMPILLPSGEDSGEWLQVLGPDCDESIKHGRAYTLAYRQVARELEELEAKCKEIEDFTEYNAVLSDRMIDLNIELALGVVTGWSFDEEFSQEALLGLLEQYSGLADAIAKHHADSRATLSAK